MGVVIKFSKKTMAGFDVVSSIDMIDDAVIHFSGHDQQNTTRVVGHIDRITGSAWALTFNSGEYGAAELDLWLTCKPTRRLF
jgi:hypothetical protein